MEFSVEGSGYSSCGKMGSGCVLKAHDITVCGKTQFKVEFLSFAKGHDFSQADKAN
jgi:hypothetical protein